MLGHRRSSANAAPAPVARILPANFLTGSALRVDTSVEGDTRIPQLLASSVLAVGGSADESW
ncbi:MAG: hypothetical protein AVDCRST_MAG10-2339 [uncultured Acidimicrobiales bacterium]|uniref:Uncharacterized protein n=1 Tax=uncultured Acidimicrobiales bacterium TaxID=310071 RepID=A0A6J4IMC1_9ACTN|nr:MAG: hypothetical protein AVDCRST_MAG10-2339 [uncultured Acidimicrobiales bacterium]